MLGAGAFYYTVQKGRRAFFWLGLDFVAFFFRNPSTKISPPSEAQSLRFRVTAKAIFVHCAVVKGISRSRRKTTTTTNGNPVSLFSAEFCVAAKRGIFNHGVIADDSTLLSSVISSVCPRVHDTGHTIAVHGVGCQGGFRRVGSATAFGGLIK